MPAQVKADKPVIMVFGDSLSAGYGIPLKKSWVSLLQARLDKNKYRYKVVNASISGDTSSSGLSRLPTALVVHKPEIVILELGGNDGLRGLPIEQTKKNLNHMLKILKSKEIKILLVGIRLPPNYGPVYTQTFQMIYKDLARIHKVHLLGFLLEGVAGYKNYMQDDGIHANSEGQPKINNNIWKKLEPLLNPVTKK